MATAEVHSGFDLWTSMPATWDLYLGLLDARGERTRPRYTFIDGRLTVVSPGHPHESHKTRLATLVDIILEDAQIDFHTSGEVTLLRSLEPRAGTEPDASYYLTNIARVVGKRDLLMGVDPPPDLVIEVVVSHPAADSIEAYRLFRVREVWFCKGGGLEFLVLGEDGNCRESPTSALLPFLAADELAPWVYRQDPTGERRIRREFRAWVAQTLAPRYRPGA